MISDISLPEREMDWDLRP